MDLLVIIIDACSIQRVKLLFVFTCPLCPGTFYTKKRLTHYIVKITTNKCFRNTRYRHNRVEMVYN